ncbi:hypothetical protein [Spirosoma foliorum]|uniref:Uncharacterized protein n=1 Tax=Spirosoma foliorum TaxID=2710596 RepID=A0A7G5H1C2_9BACT|nr:hypothetical protein [Spirosoma foliorum]QMW04914.1 hypothetical protein H3H32_08450 [Spirosoma foliorum]
MPLFMANMAYWGSFLAESFANFSAASVAKRPDWYLSMRAFYLDQWRGGSSFVLATAAFRLALQLVGWLKATACRLYVVFNLVGSLLSVLPSFSVGPLAIVTYLVSIPAFPFIIPYLMALNLLNLANHNFSTIQ